jgi:hypothetical protein
MLVLVALLWTGCGRPKHSAGELVGKWGRAEAGSAQVVLELRSDGLGVATFGPEPHGEAVRWVVARGELVLTPMDGKASTWYRFRFNGPDTLVLARDSTETVLQRLR